MKSRSRDMSPGFMPVGPLEHKKEIVVRDKNNPRALINLVPEAVAAAIDNVPDEWRDIGEPELRLIFEKKKQKIQVLDDRLRFMFWREYDGAQVNGRPMIISHVYYGICSKEIFYLLLQNRLRTAWLLCPPIDYLIATEEALTFGMEQLRDILARPHVNFAGTFDVKLASVKMDIVKMLDVRVKGAAVQTTRNLHVNVDASNKAIGEAPRIEEVDERIKELEAKLKSLNSGPKDIIIEKELGDVENN